MAGRHLVTEWPPNMAQVAVLAGNLHMENKKKNIEEKCLEQALKAGLKDRGETKRILQELVGEEIERLNTERPDFIKRHFSKSKCEKDTIVGIEHFRADHLSVLKQNGDIGSSGIVFEKDVYKLYDKWHVPVQNGEAFSEKMLEEIGQTMADQLIRLERATKYPDIRAGFKPYIAYDISDMVKGPNAEEFPENNFEWYDAKSEATSKEDKLINAVVEFGTSLGIKYEYKPLQDLQGARGYATSTGSIAIADDKRNQGLLSTAIHETAHQIMHWEVVKTKNKRLEKFYFGGSQKRGTQIVEQEAELCAWIVLQSFGYNKQQTAFNYLANWGMNKENCNNVFDQVYKVAEFVYDGVLKYANENNNIENGGK